MKDTEKERTSRRGVFLGAWVPPAMRLAVKRVADSEFYGNQSMAMMRLIDEALRVREKAESGSQK